MIKSKFLKFQAIPNLSFGIAITIFLSIVLLIGVAVFAIVTFSAIPQTPDTSPIVAEESFEHYVWLVNRGLQFLTTVTGILIAALLLTIILLGIQMFLWSKDRKKLAEWQNSGLVVERLEFLSGHRLKINGLEIGLNRAQYSTFKELINKRMQGETLHPSELPGDNGTQMIKRLREEMGGRLVEQSLIKSRRGKGYWAEIEPDNIRIRSEDD
ncbi:MAG: Unknown protein [uncultured Thiotrichaceae bacterium]|uniref:OmpR/PhoB-type domain-containing protein n=1 Tax=uncultured Thiotrichaceae bacterium TaxID=298394 RepID=A0A6S6SFA2_9GAMM|nr:MAG: Unknown protein [uncultured Thiotrichaceae bacterium]